MQTRVIEYWNGTAPIGEGEEKRSPDIRIVVRNANALVGITRAILQGMAENWLTIHGYGEAGEAGAEASEAEADEAGGAEAEAKAKERPVSPRVIAARIMARVVYPDLVATIEDAQGVDPDMSIDEFLDLPDGLTGPWQDAVYELNAHWLPSRPTSPKKVEAEKKD